MSKVVACVVGATFCFMKFVNALPVLECKADVADAASNDEVTFLWSKKELFPFLFPFHRNSRQNTRIILTTYETFFVSDNTHWDHLFLPECLETDKRHHVVAASWMELFEDLRTMETAHNIYRRVAQQFVPSKSNYVDDSEQADEFGDEPFADVANVWFERLDAALAEDPLVGKRYAQLKGKYETLVALESDHLERIKSLSTEERLTQKNTRTRYKELQVNLIFASLLIGGDHHRDETGAEKSEFRAMAMTAVEMSKNADKYEQLQRIYSESVAEAATHVCWRTNEVIGGEASALYRNLKNKIQLIDPVIRAEFEERKKEILKKLNENVK